MGTPIMITTQGLNLDLFSKLGFVQVQQTELAGKHLTSQLARQAPNRLKQSIWAFWKTKLHCLNEQRAHSLDSNRSRTEA